MENKPENPESKKTLLIATDCFMPRIDGIARFLESLLPNLGEFRVIVIAPDFKGSFVRNSDYEVHRIPLRKISIGDFTPAKKPSKDILAIVDQADLVFSQTIGPIGTAVINYAIEKNKRVVAFVHSIEWVLFEKSLSRYNLLRGFLSNFAKNHARKVYRKCDALIVPSNNIGEVFSFAGINIPKYVVHLGINLEKFRPKSREKCRKELGFEKSDFIVGYVGRIAREKSLITLKKAFKSLNGKDNRLLLVGEGIKSLEKNLKDSNDYNITITGRTEDVVTHLNAMDVFVMPSLTETTCLAVLEAMACELPVISTKVGSIREYLKDRQNGLFFPKENSVFLSIKLNYLKENPKVREKLGKTARLEVLKDFNNAKNIESILKLIRLYISDSK